MQKKNRDLIEEAVKEGRSTAKERQQMLNTYKASMAGYTYYEREDND